MAKDGMVWVDLPNTFAPRGGNRYGPGLSRVPAALAKERGWEVVSTAEDHPGDAATRAAARRSGGDAGSGGGGGKNGDEDATGTAYGDGSGKGKPSKGFPGDEDGLNALTVAELEEEAAKRNLTVHGTGASGNVVKSDLVNALRQ